jgi:hypothetical protein
MKGGVPDLILHSGCTSELAPVFGSLQLPRSVTAMACKGGLTFAAAGGVIHEANRSTP